jgi:hypothetical protein
MEIDAYVHYVRSYENGLHVRNKVDDFLFDVQYQPDDYVRLMRAGTKENYRKTLETNNEIQNLQYYVVNISVASNPQLDILDYNAQNLPDKQKRSYYFSYLFQNDIELEEGGKRYPCLLFHFERPADGKNSKTFVVGFDKGDIESTEAKLIINSSYLGSLPVKIKISKENIPSIKV